MRVNGSITQVLEEQKAQDEEVFIDDYEHKWIAERNRDGYSLNGISEDNQNAWISYWTAFVVVLPGLKRFSK